MAGCALAYAADTCSSKLPRAKKFAPLLGDRQIVTFFSPTTTCYLGSLTCTQSTDCQVLEREGCNTAVCWGTPIVICSAHQDVSPTSMVNKLGGQPVAATSSVPLIWELLSTRCTRARGGCLPQGSPSRLESLHAFSAVRSTLPPSMCGPAEAPALRCYTCLHDCNNDKVHHPVQQGCGRYV